MVKLQIIKQYIQPKKVLTDHAQKVYWQLCDITSSQQYYAQKVFLHAFTEML